MVEDKEYCPTRAVDSGRQSLKVINKIPVLQKMEDEEYRPATRAVDRGRQSLEVKDTISVLQKCSQHQSPELSNIFKSKYKGLSAEPAQKTG